MLTADRVLLLVAASLLVLGLSSRLVKRHALTPVVLALGIGVAVGPHTLGVLDPVAELPRAELLEQVSRVALALAVMDITLRTRPSDLRASARRIVVLLAVGMPAMWLVSAAGAGLLLGLPVAVALALGAALTPTDPGAASSLATGVLPNQSLPRRVRMSLQVESAANDGLALPFVLFAAFPAGRAVSDWAVEAATQLGVAVVAGAAAGYAALKLTDLADVDRLAEEDLPPGEHGRRGQHAGPGPHARRDGRVRSVRGRAGVLRGAPGGAARAVRALPGSVLILVDPRT